MLLSFNQRGAFILSVRLVLFLGIIGLQIVAVTAIIASSYVTAEHALIKLANRALSYAGEDSVEHLQGFFRPARDATLLTERLAEHEVLLTDDPSVMERYFYSQLQTTPWIDGIFYGRADGSFVFVRSDDVHSADGYYTKIISVEGAERQTEFILRTADFEEMSREADPEDRFDPRDRPWFANGLANDGLSWTRPYVFFSSGHPGISTALAVRDQAGGFVGVVGVDIVIDQIANFLAALDIGEDGAAYVLDRGGNVIAFPDVQTATVNSSDVEAGLRFVTVDELAVPAARAAIRSLGGDVPDLDIDTEVFGRFRADGRAYLSVAVPYPSGGWRWILGLYFPEDVVLAEVKRSRLINGVIAAAIGLAACVVGFFVWRGVARFAAALRDGALAVESGRFDDAWTFRSRFRDLSDTADAFGRMFECLRQREQDNAELTRSLRGEIAAHEKTEEELRTSEERYALALAGTNDGIWDWDIDTDRILISPRLAEMFGLSPDVGHLPSTEVYGYVHPDDREAFRQALVGHLKGERSFLSHECRFLRPDGSMIWALTRGLALRDGTGRAYRMSGSITDQTERRAAEERLRTSEKMEALGSLASGVAHEFNNQLVPIVALTELVMETLPESSDARANLEQVLEAAEGSQEIIDQILAFSRSRPAHVEPVVLKDMIGSALRLLRSALPPNIKLEVGLGEHGDMVSADRTQIQSVILNLCTNASHAIGLEQGTIFVTLKRRRLTDDPAGTALGLPPGDYLELFVVDTGGGMDGPTMERIFDPFFTTKPEGEGTGMGLAIVSRIIAGMGGAITVESEVGHGTTFRILLPRLDDR